MVYLLKVCLHHKLTHKCLLDFTSFAQSIRLWLYLKNLLLKALAHLIPSCIVRQKWWLSANMRNYKKCVNEIRRGEKYNNMKHFQKFDSFFYHISCKCLKSLSLNLSPLRVKSEFICNSPIQLMLDEVEVMSRKSFLWVNEKRNPLYDTHTHYVLFWFLFSNFPLYY